ncbi:MAG: hypothetical protein LC775_12435 [Acidobacteria bacterium]|nr:hypothetical protein [Acidobacteriota bacterium]
MVSKTSSALKDLALFSVKLIDMANLGIKLTWVSLGIVLIQASLLRTKSPEANDTVFDLGVTLAYVGCGLLTVSVAGQIFSHIARGKKD